MLTGEDGCECFFQRLSAFRKFYGLYCTCIIHDVSTYGRIQPQFDLERQLSEYQLQLGKTADVLNCPGNQVMMLCPLQLRMSGSHRNIVGPDDRLHIPVFLQKVNDKMYAQFKNYIIMLIV